MNKLCTGHRSTPHTHTHTHTHTHKHRSTCRDWQQSTTTRGMMPFAGALKGIASLLLFFLSCCFPPNPPHQFHLPFSTYSSRVTPLPSSVSFSFFPFLIILCPPCFSSALTNQLSILPDLYLLLPHFFSTKTDNKKKK